MFVNMKAINVTKRRNFPVKNGTVRPELSVVEQHVTLPIVDFQQDDCDTCKFKDGDLVISVDGNLYYYISKEWVPVNSSVKKFGTMTSIDSENLQISTSGNMSCICGNVILKLGTVNEKERDLDKFLVKIDGESALEINSSLDVEIPTGNLTINSGDICLKNGNIEIEGLGCINSTICTKTLTLNSDKLLLECTLNGMTSILNLHLRLEPGKRVFGKINNSLINEKSWVGCTVVNNAKGIPYVWISRLKHGHFKFNIISLNGLIENVSIHFQVRNPVN